MLKGQLSRWLLPFNTNTSVEEQQAATPRELQDSLQASSTSSVINGVGVLSEEEARYLTDGARKVRQLVRVNLAMCLVDARKLFFVQFRCLFRSRMRK